MKFFILLSSLLVSDVLGEAPSIEEICDNSSVKDCESKAHECITIALPSDVLNRNKQVIIRCVLESGLSPEALKGTIANAFAGGENPLRNLPDDKAQEIRSCVLSGLDSADANDNFNTEVFKSRFTERLKTGLVGRPDLLQTLTEATDTCIGSAVGYPEFQAIKKFRYCITNACIQNI